VALAEQLKHDNPPLVLDVRNEKEWNAGHLEGSLNIPLNHLRERVGEIDLNRMVVVHCEGGYRSAIASSILANLGRSNIMDMVGGYKAWVASNLPTQLPVDIAMGV